MGSDPSGFVLSDAAMYAFQCQEVFPDLLSFAVAIPDHLKPLFLIPVCVQSASAEPNDRIGSIAAKLVLRVAESGAGSSPTGDSDAADLFSYQSFVNYDNAPSITPGNEGSIYDDPKPDDMPVAQPGDQFCEDSTPRYDARIVTPFDTSYYGDGSSTDLFDEGYPYRSEQQVRHSFLKSVRPMKVRLALKPEVLQEHAPEKIKERANSCTVRFISYMKPTRMYTFSVHCGNVPHMVRAVLSEIDEITMTCDCPFWRWGGPEYHAKTQQFLLGKPRGTAEPPDVRDPDRKFWLCKHAYSVLRRLEHHVQQVVDEHWDLDDDDLLRTIDSEWDRLSEEAATPLEEIESEDLKMEVVQESEEEFEEEFEPEEDPELEAEEFGPESEPGQEEESWEEPEEPEEEPVVKR